MVTTSSSVNCSRASQFQQALFEGLDLISTIAVRANAHSKHMAKLESEAFEKQTKQLFKVILLARIYLKAAKYAAKGAAVGAIAGTIACAAFNVLTANGSGILSGAKKGSAAGAKLGAILLVSIASRQISLTD